MKITKYCNATEASEIFDETITEQSLKFNQATHMALVELIFRDEKGKFNVSAKHFFPISHARWNLPLKKYQIRAVLRYFRKYKLFSEYRLLLSRLKLPWYLKVSLLMLTFW